MTTEEAYKIVAVCRRKLLMKHPFFGNAAMYLELVADENCINHSGQATMATDGSHIYFHPDFVASTKVEHLAGVVAHEVFHCIALHVYRMRGKNQVIANIAADYVTNLVITGAGMTLPPGALLDNQYDGMSFEQVYAILMRNAPRPQSGPCPTGEMRPAPPPGSGQDDKDKQGQEAESEQQSGMSETDWKQAAKQLANVAKKAGKMPDSLDRSLSSEHESQTDWVAILWKYALDSAPREYSYLPPSKRYLWQNVYLPRIKAPTLRGFPFIVDTSGSMSDEDVKVASRELTAILHELSPEFIDAIYCDAAVGGSERFTPDDASVAVALKAVGGGGTNFQPAFDWIAENYEEAPPFAVFLTDLYGPAPKDPGYPVLWITSAASNMTGPFGETVRILGW